MELKIEEYQLPSKILFNFEELKAELVEKTEQYSTIVYTDDQIKEAKTDRANLNRLKKALNDERIKREREYMQPFDTFKSQINEIISIIDKPVAVIDKQIKEADEKRKSDKRVEIGALWENMEKPEWLVLTKIFDEKWLNSTVTVKAVVKEIDERLAKIAEDIKTIEAMEEFSFEALDEYKRTLDLGKAIAEGKRLADIQKRKSEQEKARAEAEAKAKSEAESKAKEQEQKKVETVQPVDMSPYMPAPEPQKADGQWIKFAAFLTVEQAKALKEFFNSNKIEFKAI